MTLLQSWSYLRRLWKNNCGALHDRNKCTQYHTIWVNVYISPTLPFLNVTEFHHLFLPLTEILTLLGELFKQRAYQMAL